MVPRHSLSQWHDDNYVTEWCQGIRCHSGMMIIMLSSTLIPCIYCTIEVNKILLEIIDHCDVNMLCRRYELINSLWHRSSWSASVQGKILLPERTRPSPGLMLTYQWGPVAFMWRHIYGKFPWYQSRGWGWGGWVGDIGDGVLVVVVVGGIDMNDWKSFIRESQGCNC